MRSMNQQLPLALPVDPALHEAMVQKKARELYSRSRFLSGKYSSFARLMEDPIAGRCLRLCAARVLRLGNGTRGR